MENFGRKSANRLSEELGASKGTIHRQIKTLEKSYRSCTSLLHELTPQQAQHRVDICCQLIGNPTDDRFIRRIVICDEKWVYYPKPNVLKQWLGSSQPAKVIVKKIGLSPK